MARKRSDEIVTRIIRQRQKNGDIYVIERKCRYDPEKKYNVVLSSRIVGKIPLGQDQVVPTRHHVQRPAGARKMDRTVLSPGQPALGPLRP